MVETETQAGLAGDSTGAGGAAVTVKPQSVKLSLADVLAKQARGDVLSPRERGVLGASKRKELAKFKFTPAAESVLLPPPPAVTPAPPVAVKPAAPPVAVTDNPLLAPVPEAAVSLVSAPDASFSAASCKLAAEAICDTISNGGQLWVGWEAEKAGANANTQAQYESAVAMLPRNRKLVVDGSEPVVRFLCRWFNCSPDKLEEALKGSGFVAGMLAHSMAVGAAVKSIRQSKAERSQPQTVTQPSQPA